MYCKTHIVDELYILDITKKIYNINTKRLKSIDSNPAYLWHCRLDHMNEKRIRKLQKYWLLKAFDYESFKTCESCLYGKITNRSFTGYNERAVGLLGLLHCDVCCLMNHTARRGFSYFILFTIDYSRYDYVYLMKHRSNPMKISKNYIVKWRTNLARRSKPYDEIVEGNIWAMFWRSY